MTLSNEQQELLHAWVDGETTEAEEQMVAELTSNAATRDELQLYVTELKRVRELLATHGGVPAPSGLRERVMAALDNDTAPIIDLPLLNWRTALVAAAAAIVVSLALVFSPPANDATNASGIATTDEQAPENSTQGQSPKPTAEPEDMTQRPSEHHGGAGRIKPGDEVDPPMDETPAEPTPPAMLRGQLAATVLQLNPGFDEPFEVSINLDRSRETSISQVYNDMLVVGSLHGEARIMDDGTSLGEWTDGEDFVGSDFTVYDGVEIQVEHDRVPELLSAINRMSSDQGYGQVILPGYMRSEVGTLTEQTRELQDAVKEIGQDIDNANARKRSEAGAQGYLPSGAQRENLRRLAKDRSDAKVDARLARLLEEGSRDAENASPKGTLSGDSGRRKVKLVIRLR